MVSAVVNGGKSESGVEPLTFPAEVQGGGYDEIFRNQHFDHLYCLLDFVGGGEKTGSPFF